MKLRIFLIALALSILACSSPQIPTPEPSAAPVPHWMSRIAYAKFGTEVRWFYDAGACFKLKCER